MKKLTRAEALNLKRGDVLIHAEENNAYGTPMKAKVTGRVQTWKTRPSDIKIPVKHGLKNCFYIGHIEDFYKRPMNMHAMSDWGIPENGEEYEKRK